MPPRIAIGTSQRPNPLRCGRRRGRELTRRRYLTARIGGAARADRWPRPGAGRVGGAQHQRQDTAPVKSRTPDQPALKYALGSRSPQRRRPIVSEVTLEERGRALENQFYEKENQEKLTAMKHKLDAQRSKDELRKASGMSDDAVLDQLVALGLRANTIAALSLVPLIQVAWADGAIQDNERTAILQGAHGKGLTDGSDGYELLQTWLKKQPGDELFVAWEAYIKALASQLNDEQNRLLKNQIVGFAKMVAAAAGGILGFGKVSSTEEKVLHRIEAAFNR
jgi:hypothetical protein